MYSATRPCQKCGGKGRIATPGGFRVFVPQPLVSSTAGRAEIVTEPCSACKSFGTLPNSKLCSKGCCYECNVCAAKSGSPVLCRNCLERRDACARGLGDEYRLKRAILDDPADATARLVYADWLEENGDEKQRRLASMIRGTWDAREVVGATASRINELFPWAVALKRTVIGVAPRQEVEIIVDGQFAETPNRRVTVAANSLSRLWVERGFLVRVLLPVAFAAKHLHRIVAEHPLTRVELNDFRFDCWANFQTVISIETSRVEKHFSGSVFVLPNCFLGRLPDSRKADPPLPAGRFQFYAYGNEDEAIADMSKAWLSLARDANAGDDDALKFFTDRG